MPTSKNQLPTLTPSAVQKYLTVNKIADQLDSISLLLTSELITALPVSPVTNKAYLVNFGANIGKILYYYLNSQTNLMTPVYVPAIAGDIVGEYVRNATTWVQNYITVAAAGTINSSVLVEGTNTILASGAFDFAFTGTVLSSLAAANPLPLPAGITQITKQGTNFYVSR